MKHVTRVGLNFALGIFWSTPHFFFFQIRESEKCAMKVTTKKSKREARIGG
jgi:hypothetical protein